MNINPAALVQRQRALFQSGRTRLLEFRRKQLRLLEDAISAHEEAILAALHADLRKSPAEAFATEIAVVLSEIQHARTHLSGWMKPRRRPVPLLNRPGRGFVQSEPLGLALIIGPWNYPFQLVLSPLVGALAAGNCAVVKPSEYAPRTAAIVQKLLESAFPEEYVAVVQGGAEDTKSLMENRFDKIFFTGSTGVGKAVMAVAARNLTPVTLELGGKSPCIVCADAPLETTARRIAWGKFMNAGQTCVAPDFVLVDRRVREGLVKALKAALQEFYGANPQSSPDYNRIINRRHFQRLTGYLDANAQVAHGGRHSEGELYIEPTIVTEVSPDSALMQEEIFGPILPVMDFETLDSALEFLVPRPTPLALYLFTTSKAVEAKVLARTRSGGVCINDTITHMLGKHLPFGGLGESGLGAYHGKASFDCFSHQRSVLRRSFLFDPGLRYPPIRTTLPMLKKAFSFLLRG